MHSAPNEQLVAAAEAGTADAAVAALADGAHVDARDTRGHTALMVACDRGELAIASVLLEAGASPNRRTPDTEETALHRLARKATATPMLSKLLQHRVRIDRADRFGWTPLMMAARTGATANVTALLAAGADASLATPDGRTAADLAAEMGHPDVLAALPGA
ncbi:MAG: ankyrin repeat protein [Myxococcota bacterium]|jgi:ankyrin repeat protein